MSINSTAPKYCYYRKNRWVFIPYVNGKVGKEITLKHNRKLIRSSDPMSWVWSAWEALKNDPSDSIGWLINKYLCSVKFDDLMPRTKRDYENSAAYLKKKELKNGSLFGNVSFASVTPGVITKLNDSMKDTPTAAKHRIQFLAAVYTWGVARDICSKNPCRDAERPSNKNRVIKQYIEDDAFNLALGVAKKLKSYLYPMMIIAYCCRARVGEISRSEMVGGEMIETGLKLSDITKEGIHVYRSKGSLPEVTLWSDFLKEGRDAAVAYSKAQIKKSNIRQIIKNPYLIHDRNGMPIKKNAFDSAWSRLIKKCLTEDENFKRFSIHELKSKGIDDHKYQESGHKTESAKAVYLRKTKRVESTI